MARNQRDAHGSNKSTTSESIETAGGIRNTAGTLPGTTARAVAGTPATAELQATFPFKRPQMSYFFKIIKFRMKKGKYQVR